MASQPPAPGSDPNVEVERLRAELARLESSMGEAPPDTVRRRRGWWRPLVAGICLLLVAVLTPLAVVAQWANAQMSDTDRYLETVAPLAADPAVQDAVIDRVTTEIVTRLDIEAVIQEVVDALAARGLPPGPAAGLTALAGPLSSGIESFVGDQVRRLVTSPEFEQAWVEANRQAHDQMVAVLTGEDGDVVEVTANSVQLNLATIIDAVKLRLADAGFTLVERLPTITATFTLFESADIARAQSAFRMLDTLATALPILAVVLLVVAVAVGRSRRRTLMVGAAVVIISVALLGAAIQLFRAVYLDAVPTERLPLDAAGAIFDQLVWFIRLNVRALLVLAVAVLVVAWLTGPDAAPAAVRRGATNTLDAVRHRSDRAGLDTGAVGVFAHTYRTPIRVLVAAVVLLVYAMVDQPTGGLVITLLAIAAVVLLVVELVARPPAETAAPAEEVSPGSPS